MVVTWSKPAWRQFGKALDYIVENGFISYADELEENIISRIETLMDNYAVYPLDKYKKNNDGTYRAFEVDDYRISYRVKGSLIRVVRLRHTSRKPSKY